MEEKMTYEHYLKLINKLLEWVAADDMRKIYNMVQYYAITKYGPKYRDKRAGYGRAGAAEGAAPFLFHQSGAVGRGLPVFAASTCDTVRARS